jgi:hypothetical protein
MGNVHASWGEGGGGPPIVYRGWLATEGWQRVIRGAGTGFLGHTILILKERDRGVGGHSADRVHGAPGR